MMKDEWDLAWENAKHGRELFRLGVRPGKDILKIHKDTHRAISSDHTDAHRQDQSPCLAPRH
jgi:hypothetical protein